ncbi:hypothetical protein COEREDRAFT_86171 [Coemansia reversa NRRL 1564]|uniref:Uncharacterized protein n=1 Tax=Coemansia reversa (strain ATCC 12441 / NRRL 1564) TaxID=763665 RepID=A0A2G5BEX7_COERN|nr:hypothetical protein COEREDRAFT_86171 [Coemansia reversa NRRL 1564]|eukprot:PIA17565.1 hypothetical protein COEREDRAFT_86171 [Coemansia reversa NRRL 1564]
MFAAPLAARMFCYGCVNSFNSEQQATRVIHGPPQHTLNHLIVCKTKALRTQQAAQSVADSSAVQFVRNVVNQIARTSTVKPAITVISNHICNFSTVVTSCPSSMLALDSVGETANQPIPALIATPAEETEFQPLCSSTSKTAVKSTGKVARQTTCTSACIAFKNTAKKTAALSACALIEMHINKAADKTLDQSVS